MKNLTAKALTAADRSGAVLVSFDAPWEMKILGRTFVHVVRKRVPREVTPDYLYFYVNSPVSRVVARAPVGVVRSVAVSHVVKNCNDFGLTRSEAEDYCEGLGTIGVYELGRFEIAGASLSREWLSERMAFFPPQSFLFLSWEARSLIDREAKFKNG